MWPERLMMAADLWHLHGRFSLPHTRTLDHRSLQILDLEPLALHELSEVILANSSAFTRDALSGTCGPDQSTSVAQTPPWDPCLP